MARVYTKDSLIDCAAVTDVAAGDGVSVGYLYGPAKWARDWKTAAVAGGWVVTWSSTRTSGAGTIANGCADSDLWSSDYKTAYESAAIALKHVATGVSVVLQRGVNPGDWRIKIATSGTYNIASGGTGTQVPTLTGEELVHGTGTDASPGFANFFPNSGSFVMQASGDSAKGDVYAFAYPAAGGATGAAGFMLSLAQLSLGRSGADTKLWIISPMKTPELGELNDESTACCWALVRKGLTAPSPTIERVKLLAVGSIPGSAASDPASGDKPCVRIRVQRDSAPADHMGRCDDLYWLGSVSSVPRTATLTTTKDLIAAGPLLMPWDGSEPV